MDYASSSVELIGNVIVMVHNEKCVSGSSGSMDSWRLVCSQCVALCGSCDRTTKLNTGLQREISAETPGDASTVCAVYCVSAEICCC